MSPYLWVHPCSKNPSYTYEPMCANSKQPDNWYIFYNYICMLLEITKYDNNETDMQENVTLQYNYIRVVKAK